MKRPKDQRVVEGNAAFFSCDVTSEPPLPRIHWTKDGMVMTVLFSFLSVGLPLQLRKLVVCVCVCVVTLKCRCRHAECTPLAAAAAAADVRRVR